MRYCITLYLKGYQKYDRSKLKHVDLLNKSWTFNFDLSFCIPLEILELLHLDEWIELLNCQNVFGEETWELWNTKTSIDILSDEHYSAPLSQPPKPSHNYENEVNYAAAMDIQQLLVTISTSALTSVPALLNLNTRNDSKEFIFHPNQKFAALFIILSFCFILG